MVKAHPFRIELSFFCKSRHCKKLVFTSIYVASILAMQTTGMPLLVHAENQDAANDQLKQFYGIQSSPASSATSVMQTHHHRLGNNTMIGASSMSTNSATSEGSASTSYMPTASLAQGMTHTHVAMPQSFTLHNSTFSQQMLTTPSLQPMIESEVSMPKIISPVSALGETWPANSSFHQPSVDVDSSNLIRENGAGGNGPFGLNNLLK